jgi:uncharacterized protein with HEPN domain
MDRFAEDKGHLMDIMRSIEEVDSYIGNASFDDFAARDNMRESVYYMLQTIGGAASLLSFEFKETYGDIDWNVLYNLNFAGYDQQVEMDPNGIWYIIKNDFPVLHNQVSDIVTVLEDKDDSFIF